MASFDFEIETSFLKEDADQVELKIRSLSSSLTKLREKMDELNGYWRGSAKTAYEAQYRRDCTTLEENISELNTILEAMFFAVKQYESCENDVRSVIDAVKL